MSPPDSTTTIYVEPEPSPAAPTDCVKNTHTLDMPVGRGDWEEPHPGRRLSYPNDTPSTWGYGAGTDVVDRSRRSDMAAKGFGTSNPDNNTAARSRPWPTRRSSRARVRHAPKNLVFSDQCNERPEIQTAPLFSSGYNMNVDALDVIKETGAVTCETATTTPATDTDSDTDATATPEEPLTIETAGLSITTSLQLTDFSNHLGGPVEIDDAEDRTLTVVESADAFSYMSPSDDMYGWDALLPDGKVTHPLSDPSPPFGGFHYRQSSRSKRGLLHRVFSTGSSSSIDRETPRIDPVNQTSITSNDGSHGSHGI